MTSLAIPLVSCLGLFSSTPDGWSPPWSAFAVMTVDHAQPGVAQTAPAMDEFDDDATTSCPDDEPLDEATPEDQPHLFLEVERLDLGPVAQGEVVQSTITLRNIGRRPLQLERIVTDCTCAKPWISCSELQPGEAVPLQVTFEAEARHGRQTQNIAIYSNDPIHPIHTVQIRADVESTYELRPRAVGLTGVLDFQVAAVGSALRQSVDILSGQPGGTLDIIAIDYDRSGLIATTRAIEHDGRRGQQVSWRIDPDAHAGAYQATARVTVRSEGSVTEIPLRVRGYVVENIMVFPATIPSFAEVLPGETLPLGKITLQSDLAQPPLEIRQILCSGAVEHRLLEVEPGHHYEIELHASQAAPSGPHAETVEITTTDPDQPLIQIPVFMQVATPILVEPAIVVLHRGTDSRSTTERRVRLIGRDGRPFKITHTSTSGPQLEVDAVAASRTEHDITIRLAEQATVGEHAGQVTVYTDRIDAPEVIIRVLTAVAERSHD